VGPCADGRVKPDFIVLGQRATVASPTGVYNGNGTSYSTPIFGGATACLMSAFPNKEREEIKAALRQSATHFCAPDSFYGYGLPDFQLAMNLLGQFDLNGGDTTGDLFYAKEKPVFFQDLSVHFRSKSSQEVKISIQGKRKKKMKQVYKMRYDLKPGEWIHDGKLLQIYNKEKRKKRKYKFKELILLVETANGSIQKTIRLNYE
jgi:hypothetical protein